MIRTIQEVHMGRTLHQCVTVRSGKFFQYMCEHHAFDDILKKFNNKSFFKKLIFFIAYNLQND